MGPVLTLCSHWPTSRSNPTSSNSFQIYNSCRPTNTPAKLSYWLTSLGILSVSTFNPNCDVYFGACRLKYQLVGSITFLKHLLGINCSPFPWMWSSHFPIIVFCCTNCADELGIGHHHADCILVEYVYSVPSCWKWLWWSY